VLLCPNWLPSSIEPCSGVDDESVCGWSSRADHRAVPGLKKNKRTWYHSWYQFVRMLRAFRSLRIAVRAPKLLILL
jgi:hypothetical protein